MFNYSEKCQKSGVFSVFWRVSKTPEFWPYDVTHYNKNIFFFDLVKLKIDQGFQMYNIMGIWPIDQELLSCKSIATLRWNEMKQEAWRRPRISDHWLTDYLYIYLSIYLYTQYAHIYLAIYLSGGRNCRTLHLRQYLATLSIFMQILKILLPSSSICTILWVRILRKCFPPPLAIASWYLKPDIMYGYIKTNIESW